ncbi:uncharacterized protein LOC125502115 isoform X1 [Athalia rosae]|uniref:uncharacterized protein LOC125502115 isoform X1 n=1 Tax=Athalia rosae TaxID=37344 RepID=UPI0020332107|nr:uncharacterized protein LOC125502115 isoform X1 [Athalia rosae]
MRIDLIHNLYCVTLGDMHKVQRTLFSDWNLEKFSNRAYKTQGVPQAQQVTCISEASIQLCATWCSYISAIQTKEIIFYA